MSSLDHIYKGPKGQRELTDICVVEFASNSIREEVIKKFQKRSEINNAKLANLQADRAKTQIQLKRNTALRDALSKIKGDPRNKNKKCDNNNKNRSLNNNNKSRHKDWAFGPSQKKE